MRSRAALGLLAVVALSGCGITVGPPRGQSEPCPRTVAEALATEMGEDAFIATGHVVRFVGAPRLDSRGYDINVALEGEANYDTYFLRVANPVGQFDGGEPVLVVAVRSRLEHVVLAGPCEPLVSIPEEDVEYADDQGALVVAAGELLQRVRQDRQEGAEGLDRSLR